MCLHANPDVTQPAVANARNLLTAGQRRLATALLGIILTSASGADSSLANISTRGYAGTGDEVLIGGMIITGSQPLAVVVRAVGPSINEAFVPVNDQLADPYLQLFSTSGQIDTNDNWAEHASAGQLPDGLRPAHPAESALVTTLLPGAYTAIVGGVGNTTGIGLIEIFALDTADAGRLTNISTRGHTGTGDAVLIGGVIVEGDSPRAIAIRARGPSIDTALVPAALQLGDPKIQLFAGSRLIDENDNWRDHYRATELGDVLQPTLDQEAALVATLAPGAYTAIVTGAGATTGIGIVEVFEIDAGITAESVYAESVDHTIIQADCITCHTIDGVAANSSLVYLAPGIDGYLNVNFTTLRNFVNAAPGNETLVLDRATGVGHPGGQRLQTGSDSWQLLSDFLELLAASPAPDQAPAFFAGARISDAETTLRRAALIVARRLPTESELASVSAGSDETLAAAMRSLMSGPGFHEFLVQGANDQLHTDAFLNGLFLQTADLNVGRLLPVGANRFYNDQPARGADRREKFFWVDQWRFGLTRAPLELIAYVVENNLPYTEILTANYTMVNPLAAEILRSGVSFDSDDPTVFKPGQHRGQVLRTRELQATYEPGRGTEVTAHGAFVDYPHAGILNTQAFLNRYPTTETNRNRARARWTFKHFLGTDIERSAPRTTDATALADTNNPTLYNPACTVCHATLDPLAGAFQNYGNDGFYRDRQGGLDALPPTYKFPQLFDDRATASPYQTGDTWFRDMRDPGLFDAVVPDADRSLAWVAEQIVADPLFASAAVKFWWPALMGAAPIEAPEVATDPNFRQVLATFEAQDTFIQSVGESFADGFDGGRPFDARDLFVAMMMSPWFRTDGFDPAVGEAGLGAVTTERAAGTRRLLTPDELEAKTADILGFRWGERRIPFTANSLYTNLVDQFGIYYGGIDSNGIQTRARSLTALMANVAERQAVAVACPAVVTDFARPPADRRLFRLIEPDVTPEGAENEMVLRNTLVDLHQKLLGQLLPADDPEITGAYELLRGTWQARRDSPFATVAWAGPDEACALPVSDALTLLFRDDPTSMKNAWSSVLIYLLTDFHYLHE